MQDRSSTFVNMSKTIQFYDKEFTMIRNDIVDQTNYQELLRNNNEQFIKIIISDLYELAESKGEKVEWNLNSFKQYLLDGITELESKSEKNKFNELIKQSFEQMNERVDQILDPLNKIEKRVLKSNPMSTEQYGNGYGQRENDHHTSNLKVKDSLLSDKYVINQNIHKIDENLRRSLNQFDKETDKEDLQKVIENSKTEIQHQMLSYEEKKELKDNSNLESKIEEVLYLLKNRDRRIGSAITNDLIEDRPGQDYSSQTTKFMKNLFEHIRLGEKDIKDKKEQASINKMIGAKLANLFNGHDYNENLILSRKLFQTIYDCISNFVKVSLEFIELVSLFTNKLSSVQDRALIKPKIRQFCKNEVEGFASFKNKFLSTIEEFFFDLGDVAKCTEEYSEVLKGFHKENTNLIREIMDVIKEGEGDDE